MEPDDFQVTPNTTRLLEVPVGSALGQFTLPQTVLGDAIQRQLAGSQTLVGPANGEPPKRKRGPRPAKDLSKAAAPAQLGLDGEPIKRKRGRPLGSKNRIVRNGAPLVPQVLTIQPREDVVEKLKELARTYNRSLCILAASGTLSSATLAQVGQLGHSVGVTLRGHFTVLSISGAILQQPEPADTAAAAAEPAAASTAAAAANGAGSSTSSSTQQRRPPLCFISASLANPTGGVVGGTVVGALEANSTVTVVVGHWEPDLERPLPDIKLLTALPLGGDTHTGAAGLEAAGLQHEGGTGGADLTAGGAQSQGQKQGQQDPTAAAIAAAAGLPILGQYTWQARQ